MSTVNTHILADPSRRSRSCCSPSRAGRRQASNLRTLLVKTVRTFRPASQATRLRLWAQQTRNQRDAALYRAWSDAIRRYEKETREA
jgi:hypothetical protein